MKSVAELCRPRPNVFVDTARDDVLNLSDLIEGNIDPEAFSEKEKLLLCSDGLTNFVTEAEITRILASDDYESMAQRLVAAANENGGGDNITAVVILK